MHTFCIDGEIQSHQEWNQAKELIQTKGSKIICFFHVNATKLVDRKNLFPNMLMKLLKYWAVANNVYQCMSFMCAVKFAQVLSLGDFHQMERLRGVTILELRRDFRWDLDETFLRPVIQCHESSGTHCRVDTWPTPSVSLKHWDRFCWIGSGPHCPPW